MKILNLFRAIDDKVNEHSKATLPEDIKEQCTDHYDKTLERIRNAAWYGMFIVPIPVYILTNKVFAASTAFFGLMATSGALKITVADRVWKQYRRDHVKRDNLSSQQDFIFQERQEVDAS